MVNTSFFDPTGLSTLNFSTAEDLEKLAIYILKNAPDFFLITRTPTLSIQEQMTGVRRSIINNNVFAGRPWFIGGKTGYTDDARGNLLTMLSHNNRTFTISILGSSDRFGDTERIIDWITVNY
jgi:D-alanyl-D-alanine carboxypeptidase